MCIGEGSSTILELFDYRVYLKGFAKLYLLWVLALFILGQLHIQLIYGEEYYNTIDYVVEGVSDRLPYVKGIDFLEFVWTYPLNPLDVERGVSNMDNLGLRLRLDEEIAIISDIYVRGFKDIIEPDKQQGYIQKDLELKSLEYTFLSYTTLDKILKDYRYSLFDDNVTSIEKKIIQDKMVEETRKIIKNNGIYSLAYFVGSMYMYFIILYNIFDQLEIIYALGSNYKKGCVIW